MCNMMNRDKIKVVDCRDFGREFDDLCVLLSDYEDIDCDNYDSQLESLIKNAMINQINNIDTNVASVKVNIKPIINKQQNIT